MAVVFSNEKAQRTADTVHLVTSEVIPNAIDELAVIVTENEGNAIIEGLTEECRRVQSAYNDKVVPAFVAIQDEARTIMDFDAAIKRSAANAESVKIGGSEVAVDKIQMPEI